MLSYKTFVFSFVFIVISASNFVYGQKTVSSPPDSAGEGTIINKKRTQTDWANLKKYAADNKRVKSMSGEDRRVVFMGNSITELWITTDSSFFAGKPYVNRGISGQTSQQMLVRFRQDVIELKPQLVVILAGINDIGDNISLENILGNIVSMTELARTNNINVILSSVLPVYEITWRPELKPAEHVVKLNAMIKSYADKNDIFYLDYYSSMVDERMGLKAEYTYDGVHPTLAGFKVMGPLVERAIAIILGK